ncbi:hypothetical protein E2C01_079026 [Portunus trituberculatus]|uniref:Uncharacterized protein n=1 Tax=Portunus trituberculatus TaxID=210409 RepID=A0A5B7IQB8_PORTR|nr:hypothetical protein [Portunus trituberculatus]
MVLIEKEVPDPIRMYTEAGASLETTLLDLHGTQRNIVALIKFLRDFLTVTTPFSLHSTDVFLAISFPPHCPVLVTSGGESKRQISGGYKYTPDHGNC